MAIDLNAAQVKALQAAGLTPSEIRAFQLGTASTQLRIKATNAIKSGTHPSEHPNQADYTWWCGC
jgi:DNA primase